MAEHGIGIGQMVEPPEHGPWTESVHEPFEVTWWEDGSVEVKIPGHLEFSRSLDSGGNWVVWVCATPDRDLTTHEVDPTNG